MTDITEFTTEMINMARALNKAGVGRQKLESIKSRMATMGSSYDGDDLAEARTVCKARVVNILQHYDATIAAEMDLTHGYTSVDDLVKALAHWTIRNNYWRKNDEDVHELTQDQIRVMNAANRCMGADKKTRWEDGYAFLDEDGGKTGMVRLYIAKGGGNPKWSFCYEGDKLKVGHA
jgi:hypothetical protein